MSINHGITVLEQATGVRPPVTASAAMPVFFGTAPVHRTANPAAAVNRPIVCFSFADAVAQLGYSDDWENFTLCEAMSRQFRAYSVAPAVFVNVFNSELGKTAGSENILVVNGRASLVNEMVDPSTLTVQGGEIEVDYTVTLTNYGLDINVLPGGSLAAQPSVMANFMVVNPGTVTKTHIIGGIDPATGARTGIELVDDVFPKTRLVPGILAAPGWNDIEVSLKLQAKAASINNLFGCMAVVDVPDSAGPTFRDIPSWKEQSGLSSKFCIVCWPRVSVGNRTVHLSTDITGRLGLRDAEMGDIPYASPSNRPLQITGMSWRGKEITHDQQVANYIESCGIVTTLNWTGGWVAWGNYTAAYPGNTDPKDMWIAIRRMFNWVRNSIILSYWQRIDLPIRRVLIDDIVTSCNMWFDGLVSSGALLGGRIEFPPELNPATSLMSGKIVFRVFICPPVPAAEIEFQLEYDPQYLSTLFD